MLNVKESRDKQEKSSSSTDGLHSFVIALDWQQINPEQNWQIFPLKKRKTCRVETTILVTHYRNITILKFILTRKNNNNNDDGDDDNNNNNSHLRIE